MGKSGGRRKKGRATNPANSAAADAHPNPPHPATPSAATTTTKSPSLTTPPPANGLDFDASVFLRRAHELKEEGNRRFQTRDYAGALEQYDLALKLVPRSHPDRAVFHSNRAACLMQMRPIDHEAVAAECTLALLAQPRYSRALLRRARAFEALGRIDAAFQDVQALLATDPSHQDALDLARRLRAYPFAGPRQQQEAAQQDLQSRPSPAALGASAVRGAPIGGLGPCLPGRPAPKKSSPTPQLGTAGKSEKLPPQPLGLSENQRAVSNGPEFEVLTPKAGSELSKAHPSEPSGASVRAQPVIPGKPFSGSVSAVSRWRPLKLVYDHDIRLAQMPENCSCRVLRQIVAKRFPSSKSVLIKYKDAEGDLVTVTSTDELRLAESCVNPVASKASDAASESEKRATLPMLRLYIVEVSAEQEPPMPEEEEEKPVEDEGFVKHEESLSQSLAEDTVAENGNSAAAVVENVDASSGNAVTKEEVTKEKSRHKECNHAECKEVEIDDWLFEFAQLFRTQVGIDPDAHLDLHELGMELCSEALEETVTSEGAQELFEMAASKFQEVAALAFFNWGNVHMCAARKRIPLDNSAPKEAMTAQLQAAYDWVRERYALAGKKYEEALQIKPDFYEGLLALGQQHFETAKLQWSFALANKVNLASWDSSETIQLFNSAEEKMMVASVMWEKLEEQRAIELKDPITSKRDELLKRRKKPGFDDLNGEAELTADESAEQTAIMRSQIHLFWGNMLFERSQVEFKLGLVDWKKNLDAAVERFKLAGASEADISVVLKNHSSNSDGMEDEKKVTHLSSTTTETFVKDEDKHVVES